MDDFVDRQDAGRQLAHRIRSLKLRDPVIIALPRGGVPVAMEVARLIHAPLDVLVVRKVGAPDNPEYAMGAVTEEGNYFVDHRIASILGISPTDLEESIDREKKEAKRRAHIYRSERPMISVKNRTVLLVDDGLATGSTARAALQALKHLGAARRILAIPVGAPESVTAIQAEADQVICLQEPEAFSAVSQWYQNFNQVSDGEVISSLEESRKPSTIKDPESVRITGSLLDTGFEESSYTLTGDLSLPEPCLGIVLFAHGSGSSRRSPRNRQVANALNKQRLGTLLFDLLTPEESSSTENVFDLELLSDRLISGTRFIQNHPSCQNMPIGYFGASTGAGAAIRAAAELQKDVQAIVSRGGRVDLAESHLKRVQAPTLLIVGENDRQVLALNKEALGSLAHGELSVIPHATHLFEEPGALEEVAELAGSWFTRFFGMREVQETLKRKSA